MMLCTRYIFPQINNEIEKSRYRLKFEELFLYSAESLKVQIQQEHGNTKDLFFPVWVISLTVSITTIYLFPLLERKKGYERDKKGSGIRKADEPSSSG